jgi:hypothetical protein
MSDLARLPSYPSPTTLIARSGIQFLDFGFDPVRLKVREWGFHDTGAGKADDDQVQLDFDEVRRSSKCDRTTSSARARPTGRGCAWSISRRATVRAIATSRATATAPCWPSTPA